MRKAEPIVGGRVNTLGEGKYLNPGCYYTNTIVGGIYVILYTYTNTQSLQSSNIMVIGQPNPAYI